MYRNAKFFISAFFLFFKISSSGCFASSISEDAISDINGNMSAYMTPYNSSERTREVYDEEVDRAEREKLREELADTTKRCKVAEDDLQMSNDQVEQLILEINLWKNLPKQDGSENMKKYISGPMTEKLNSFKKQLEKNSGDNDLQEDVDFYQAKINEWENLLRLHCVGDKSGVANQLSELEGKLSALREELNAAKAKLEKNLLSKEDVDEATAVIAAPRKTVQQRLDDMRKTAK